MEGTLARQSNAVNYLQSMIIRVPLIAFFSLSAITCRRWCRLMQYNESATKQKFWAVPRQHITRLLKNFCNWLWNTLKGGVKLSTFDLGLHDPPSPIRFTTQLWSHLKTSTGEIIKHKYMRNEKSTCKYTDYRVYYHAFTIPFRNVKEPFSPLIQVNLLRRSNFVLPSMISPP